MMNYKKPEQVQCPREHANHITPLFDGGENGYSIAILEDSDGEKNIGIRWNVSKKEWNDKRKKEDGMLCVGMPQSRGYSVWFILPPSAWKFIPQMIKDQIASTGQQNQIPISEKQIQEEVNSIL